MGKRKKKERFQSKAPPMTKPMLSWMRAKKDETDCSHRRTWESRCRMYKVQECVGKLAGMGTHYYAICGMEILPNLSSKRDNNRHKTRKAAETTCEKHVRLEV